MLFEYTVKEDTSTEVSSVTRMDLTQCFGGKEEGSGLQLLIWQRHYLTDSLE